MNKQSLIPQWDMQRLRVGVGLRLVELVPADKLDSHPIPNMRTPKELIVHMFGFLAGGMEGLVAGALGNTDEKALVASLGDRAKLLAWARECWGRADAAFAKVTDAHLSAMVTTPWGESYPGVAIFGFAPDEFLHHRGQLYVYLRALGVEPPMNWDFEHNAPEFQPKAHAAG